MQISLQFNDFFGKKNCKNSIASLTVQFKKASKPSKEIRTRTIPSSTILKLNCLNKEDLLRQHFPGSPIMHSHAKKDFKTGLM